MKDVTTLMKLFGRNVSDNSPVILTSMAVTGVVGTAVLSVKAGMKSVRTLDDAAAKGLFDETPPTKRAWYLKQAQITWQHYIPAAAVGISTIACVIGGHSIHTKRQAAIMGLYSVTDTAFKDYQVKVKDLFGEQKEQAVRDEVSQDLVKNNPVSGAEVIMIASGDQLCYDTYTGQYFMSDAETIRKAQNDVNEEVINNCYASQNFFYSRIGMRTTAYGEEVGWKIGQMMDLYFSSTLDEKGRPCLAVNYRAEPIRDYYRSL